MSRQEILDKLETIKKNQALPEKQKQQLIELYEKKISLLEPEEKKESQSEYKKELKRQIEAGEIEDESKGISLYHLANKIQKEKEVEEKPAKAKKTSAKKASAKKAKPAKKATKNEAKPKGTGKIGRPKKETTKEAVSEPKKSNHVITVNGKEYDIDDCKEAISAWKARKEQATKTQKQYKTKAPSVKAKDNVEDAIDHIGDSISNRTIKENPKKVISALKTFKQKMESAFTSLNPILKEIDIKRLKSALAEIDEVIKSIEQ